jgi:hypothetical protein
MVKNEEIEQSVLKAYLDALTAGSEASKQAKKW